MNPSSAITPIQKTIVLVGAGNAHLVFVKRWGMRPLPGVAVTLVNEAATVAYSAMVPACIAGDHAADEATVDLVRLCHWAKVRFTPERATGVDPAARKVLFGARPPLAYDALSLGLGSLPACPGDTPSNSTLILRPLARLMQQIDALEERLRQNSSPFHLVVVGGGASGCELALAIHKRLGSHPGFRATLLQGNPRLLPEFPKAVARAFERELQRRGVAFRVNARAACGGDGHVSLESGERVQCDAVLWATEAAAPRLIRESGLAVNAAGFLRVAGTLQSVADPAVFGTGDCVSFESRSDLPKNGVYAVREGAVLFDNIAAFLREAPLRPFRPQRYCLCLLNTADEEAVLRYGPLVLKGRWARRLKDRIDRAWMDRMTRFAPMTAAGADPTEAPWMRCGGCGSKISSDVLSAVLKRLDLPDDPRVLLGVKAGEDAAVHRVRPALFGPDPAQLVEVQTVDYFKAFLDDPYLFGRIAALNAVSDLYAMNARPFSALAIATLPYARGPVQEAQLFELLSGAVESLRRVGVVLTGGHTTEGSELALGFAVTGFAEEGRLFRKGNLRPGDQLILTKALGSGALLAAWMRGECRAAWFEPLIASMLRSNGPAAEIFRDAGVTACTDVTGFGLAGHLLEMLDASRVSARLSSGEVQLYQGFNEVVSHGVLSSLHEDNAKRACRVRSNVPPPAWLFDPQTSGGLLGAVPAESVERTLDRLRQSGCAAAAVIGEAVAMEADGAPSIVFK